WSWHRNQRLRNLMNRFSEIIFRAGLVLLALVALQPVFFASVDDARSFAPRLPNHTLNKDSKCVRITGEATLGRVKKKQCGSNCSKETNIGSGWEQKSIGRRFPFTFMTRTESLRKNQTDGKKATSRPHT